MKNISDNKKSYELNIKKFLNELTSEKKFIKLTIKRVVRSHFLVIEEVGSEIVGLAGAREKFFFLFLYFVVRRDFHGQGLGAKLVDNLRDVALIHGKILFAISDINNQGSQHILLKTGFVKVGQRNHIVYYILAKSIKGKLLSWAVKQLFPSLRIIHSLVVRGKKWHPEE